MCESTAAKVAAILLLVFITLSATVGLSSFNSRVLAEMKVANVQNGAFGNSSGAVGPVQKHAAGAQPGASPVKTNATTAGVEKTKEKNAATAVGPVENHAAVSAVLKQPATYRSSATPGIVMWAYGRSGTTLMMHTLSTQVHPKLVYCNHHKEAFGLAEFSLSRASLKACMARGHRLTMLKPGFLLLKASTLRTVDAFFQALATIGYVIIIGVWRENRLARTLSQIDLRCLGTSAAKENATAERIRCAHESAERTMCHGQSILSTWEYEDKYWHSGIKKATELGLHVIRFTYAQLAADTCGAVKNVTRVLSRAAHKHFSTGGCTPRGNERLHNASLHQLSAQDRMGPSAYKCLLRDMRASKASLKYLWMLNLTQELPKPSSPGHSP